MKNLELVFLQLDDVKPVCNEGRPFKSGDEAVAEWISAGEVIIKKIHYSVCPISNCFCVCFCFHICILQLWSSCNYVNFTFSLYYKWKKFSDMLVTSGHRVRDVHRDSFLLLHRDELCQGGGNLFCQGKQLLSSTFHLISVTQVHEDNNNAFHVSVFCLFDTLNYRLIFMNNLLAFSWSCW